MASIFKACDIRGVYGEELTEDIVRRIGAAIGSRLQEWHKAPQVVLAGDVRTHTPSLKAAVSEGLAASGVLVLDVGIVPTPVFYFSLKRLAVHGGVMVTASHNPREYNGLKVILGDFPVTEEGLQEIRRRAEDLGHRPSAGPRRGSERVEEVVEDYRAFLRDRFPKAERRLKIVVDCGSGCESPLAPAAFREAGFEVVELFCEEDGAFPFRGPDVSVARNLAPLSERVLAERAGLGLAFDGDGDRVAFVDNRGRIVAAEVTGALLARHLLEKEPGAKVVYDLKCSSAFAEAVRQAGGVPLMEKSGHTFIRRRMIEEQALFGVEVSGHFFHRSLQGGDDGLYTAMMLASLVDAGQRSLAESAEQVPRYPITPDLRLPCGDVAAVLGQVEERFGRFPLNHLDGIRVEFPDGWALARASVTEPLITLRFEGRDEASLQRILLEFAQALPSLRSHLLEETAKHGEQ